MKRQGNKSTNYLDFIPLHCASLRCKVDEMGNVTLFQENKGVFHFLAQKILKKPKVSQIHLDEMGNFVWPLIDGTRTVYEIAQLVKEEFGEKAEPLYERLVQYIQTLENYGFIEVREKTLDKANNL